MHYYFAFEFLFEIIYRFIFSRNKNIMTLLLHKSFDEDKMVQLLDLSLFLSLSPVSK